MPKSKRYEIFNRERNKIIKTGKREWIGILCEKKLRKKIIHCWKISLKKSYGDEILVGVASEDFDSSSYYKGGWHICLCCGRLYSGEPHNYKNEIIKEFNFNNDIVLIMDMKKKII